MENIESLVKSLTEEVRDLKSSMTFMNSKFEDCMKELREERRQKETLNSAMNEMKERIKLLEDKVVASDQERIQMEESLQTQINQLEAERRVCNLELQGIQEEQQENCIQVVSSIVSKITPDIHINEIKSAFRVGSKTNKNGSARNRTIVFTLNTKDARNKIYFNRKNLNKLSGNPIYINENLSYITKQLLAQANRLRKEKQYKFLYKKLNF